MAVVDSRHQVIVGATAIGKQYEGEDLIPLLEASKADSAQSGISTLRFEGATVLADTNYFTEANCSHFLDSVTLKGVIPDPQF